jgi:hypothetical protein
MVTQADHYDAQADGLRGITGQRLRADQDFSSDSRTSIRNSGRHVVLLESPSGMGETPRALDPVIKSPSPEGYVSGR